MRRRLSLIGLWAAATAVAVVVALAGVRLVADRVTAAPAVPAATTLAAPSETTSAAPNASTSPSATPSTAPSTPDDDARTPATQPPRTPSTPRTTTSSSSPPPSATQPPPPPPSTSSPTSESAGITKTYEVQGGTASIRFRADAVEVLYATPRTGFTVRVERESSTSVEIRFESDSHRSDIEAWWDGGPRDDVEEEDRSEGGDDEDPEGDH